MFIEIAKKIPRSAWLVTVAYAAAMVYLTPVDFADKFIRDWGYSVIVVFWVWVLGGWFVRGRSQK